MKLKTLKDIEPFCYLAIKLEAIKWVKDDFDVINNSPLLNVEEKIAKQIVSRWARRFDITEEDLK